MGPLAGHHGGQADHTHQHRTGGRLLDRGWRYDVGVWFFDTFLFHGSIGELRRKVLELARLREGAALLDVGCGTGTLAIEAARVAGPAGRVAGVDPAPRQIARARSKAMRSGRPVDFVSGVIEDVPFPDGSFDAVTSTLMLHHLPVDTTARGLAEIRRVLRPGGRLVVADFNPDPGTAGPAGSSSGTFVRPQDLPDVLRETGFVDVEALEMAFPRSHKGWSGATLVSTATPPAPT